MNNIEVIKWGSEISKKTNHELIGMLYSRHEEMRIIFSILNQREEESMEVIKLAKKGKPKEETKPNQ